ncbi:MAG: single-stranded-DNA-specific exonuclease RecJ [Actinomycetota bacterium]
MESIFHRWRLRNKKKQEKAFNLSYSPVLTQILANRGIVKKEDINLFLKPSIKYLHDPFLLPNMESAVERLIRAVKDREKILIFGDYDADGVISAAILYNFLDKLDAGPQVYIPSRFDEGYDISLDFIKKVKDSYGLVICVDCGTNSLKVQQHVLAGNGPDFIVCDHHEPVKSLEEDNNPRYIIINPKLRSSGYPFKHLSGGGVTFKFIIATLRKISQVKKVKFQKSYLNELLDLVAVSTIADVMPIIDENRVIVKKGLKLMGKTSNKGLRGIIENVLEGRDEISAYDVAFIIAPRLNAAGRIERAYSSIELLKNGCMDIDKKVCKLNGFNQKRKKIQDKIFKGIISSGILEDIVRNERIYVGKSEEWNEGVLGIVASDIVKKYNIPAILFKEKGEELKGSGRSIPGFNLYESLSLIDKYFIKYGGHELACGITMEKSKYEDFKREIARIASNAIREEDIKKKLYYDLEINFSQIDPKLVKDLKLLEPCGVGNPKPAFMTKKCTIRDIRLLKGGKHVKLSLKNSGTSLQAIMFGVGEQVKEKIRIGSKINILYYIQENEWMGNKNIQLVLVDLF